MPGNVVSEVANIGINGTPTAYCNDDTQNIESGQLVSEHPRRNFDG